MLTRDIIQELRNYPDMKVMSESADPRLVDEIGNAGIRIYPVDKSGRSIIAGIDKMLEYNIYVTKRSYNMLNEFRNYVWDKDKDGRPINQPADGQQDHLIDAVRYYVLGMILGKIRTSRNLEGIF